MTRSLALPAPLVSQPDTVARRIVNGIERGADVVYAPAYWRAIMLVVRSIPRAIFKRMKL
jgi:short-subunit dehydrogenase